MMKRLPFIGVNRLSFSIGKGTALLLLLTLLAIPNLVFSQSYPLNHYSVEQGLAQSVINTIVQDHNGIIWFGTQDGISRFDGQSFTNYSTGKGLSHNVVRKMIKGPDKTLWIATDDGLSLFDLEEETFRVLRPPVLPGERVRGLFKDSDGNIWVGTNHGVIRNPLSENPLTITAEDGLPHEFIFTIAQDTSGQLWLGTDNGIAIWQDSIHTVYNTQNGLVNHRVRTLHPAPDGTMWIGSYADGVTHFKNQTFSHYSRTDGLPPNRVTNMFSAQDSTVWMGTDGGGALAYQNGSFETFGKPQGLANSSVSALYQDHEGNYWFGTFGGGVYKWSFRHILAYTTDHGLTSNNITSSHRTHEGELWIGTNNEGITRIQGKQVRYLNTDNGLPDNRIFVIYEDSKHDLWIGTDGGLTHYQNGRLRTWDTDDGLTSTSVRTIIEASDGSMWFGTFRGGAYQLKNGQLTHYSVDDILPNNDVFNIREATNGNIWIGTDGGISIVSDGSLANILTTDDGLIDNRVSTLQQGNDGRMWIGTFGGGLSIYDQGTFKNISSQEGLPNNIICFTLQDQNEIWWIGTKNGLAKYDGQQFSYFNAQNGLPSDEINQRTGFMDHEGYLWFGTIEGITRLNPNQQNRNEVPPPVYITDLSIFEEDTTTNTFLDLSYNENYLKFEYLALCYTNPENVLYKYKLDGLDNKWHTTTNRNIQYTSLAPGEYTFHVIARNNDGVWNEIGDNLSFEIHPPFWNTYWFMGSSVLVLLILGFWGLQWREARLQQYNKKLKRLVNEKTEELQRSEHLFRLIMENAGDLITMTSANGEIEYVSPSSIKLLGYRPAEIIGHNIRSYIHPEDLRKVSLGSSQAIRSNKTRNIEHRLKHRDGTWHTFISTQNVVHNDEDNDTSLIIISHDITERKQAEEQLVEAKENAEAANKAKSTFLANMSHELRTPLNAILGFSQILHRNRNIPVKERDYVQIMHKSGRHLLSMINDILDLSKVEAGRMELHPEVFEIKSFLGDLRNMFELKARDKGITLTMHLGDSIPTHIKLDPKKLRQILINLISNAIKFTDEGSVSLEVQALGGEESSQLEFKVIDTGRGISASEIEEIFKPFQQSKMKFSQGTGLGLSISQHLAELMGGSLSATSKQGAGSTFTLKLPYEDVDEADQISHFGEERKKVKSINSDREWSILVVDDVDENRALVTAMLEEAGFHCVEAIDGHDAIKTYQAEEPDLIIMDIVMPRMDGREAFQRIRALNKSVPIVALTASGFANTRQELIDMGFDDYISKPFSEHELFSSIGEQLDLTFEYSDKPLDSEGSLNGQDEQYKREQLKHIASLILELDETKRMELRRAIEFTDIDSLKKLLPNIKSYADLHQRLSRAIRDGDYRFLLELDEYLVHILDEA
jgi:PAS domain S-box-containing protein